MHFVDYVLSHSAIRTRICWLYNETPKNYIRYLVGYDISLVIHSFTYSKTIY